MLRWPGGAGPFLAALILLLLLLTLSRLRGVQGEDKRHTQQCHATRHIPNDLWHVRRAGGASHGRKQGSKADGPQARRKGRNTLRCSSSITTCNLQVTSVMEANETQRISVGQPNIACMGGWMPVAILQ